MFKRNRLFNKLLLLQLLNSFEGSRAPSADAKDALGNGFPIDFALSGYAAKSANAWRDRAFASVTSPRGFIAFDGRRARNASRPPKRILPRGGPSECLGMAAIPASPAGFRCYHQPYLSSIQFPLRDLPARRARPNPAGLRGLPAGRCASRRSTGQPMPGRPRYRPVTALVVGARSPASGPPHECGAAASKEGTKII